MAAVPQLSPGATHINGSIYDVVQWQAPPGRVVHRIPWILGCWGNTGWSYVGHLSGRRRPDHVGPGLQCSPLNFALAGTCCEFEVRVYDAQGQVTQCSSGTLVLRDVYPR